MASSSPSLPHTGNTCNLRRISHEIMYMVFFLFPLIQERQFLVISESICTLDHFVLVNRLEGPSISARRSGVARSFNCIPGNHRPRISQSDLLLHARDSRNPKPIFVKIPVMLNRCNLISHKPTHSHSCSAISNGMESQNNLPACSRDEFWSVPGKEMMHSGDAFKCTIPRFGSHSRPLHD